MKFEDIKIGMKVIPISKTYGYYSYSSIDSYFFKKKDTFNKLKKNGYLIVEGFENSNTIMPKDHLEKEDAIVLEGDFFHSRDLILFIKDRQLEFEL
jgi:hypothetical protein